MSVARGSRDWRSPGRRNDPPHRLVEEHERLEPDVAAQQEDPPSSGLGGVDHADDPLEARQAVAGGQVRGALRQGVERPPDAAAAADGVHDRSGEPPVRGRSRVVGRPVQKLLDVSGEGVGAGDVLLLLARPGLEERAVASDAGCWAEKGIFAGEAEEAAWFLGVVVVVVVDGGGLVVRTRPLRVLERGGDAV